MPKQTIASLLAWLLISFTLLTYLFYTVPISAKIIKVPQDYSTIQAAINAAKKGGIIQVSAGDIYYENVVINKEIKLMGADKTTTISLTT